MVDSKVTTRFKKNKVEYKVSASKTGKGYDIFKNELGRWKKVMENMSIQEVIAYQMGDLSITKNQLMFLSMMSKRTK